LQLGKGFKKASKKVRGANPSRSPSFFVALYLGGAPSREAE
jgi:hypothetical protein